MALSSHATRWLISLIAAPILLYVILAAPPMVLYLIVLLVGAAVWPEFYGICFPNQDRDLLIVAEIGWALTVLATVLLGPGGLAVGTAVGMAMGAYIILLRYEKIDGVIDQVGRYALGQVYITLFFGFLIPIYDLENGRLWLLFCLLVAFLGDTSAYYAGKSLGRRTLYPAVSPKKTWEGLGGNVAGAALTGGLYIGLLLPPAWWEGALLGAFLGLWGAGGDLFESMIKRSAGVKDAGKILMGHGGFMDRIDALLFNLPVIYLFALTRTG